MNTTTQLTADQQYTEHQNAILDLLDELRSELGMHEVHFDRTGRRHWGYPGDLGHVRELLNEIHAFLTNEE